MRTGGMRGNRPYSRNVVSGKPGALHLREPAPRRGRTLLLVSRVLSGRSQPAPRWIGRASDTAPWKATQRAALETLWQGCRGREGRRD